MRTQFLGLMIFDNVLFSLYLDQTQDGCGDLKIFEVVTSLPPHGYNDQCTCICVCIYLYLCVELFCICIKLKMAEKRFEEV